MKKEAFDNKDSYSKKIKGIEEELITLDERFAYGKFDLKNGAKSP